MKHLKYFEQASEYDIFKKSEDWVTPNVSYIESVNKLFYEKTIVPVINIDDYCTIVALEDNTEITISIYDPVGFSRIKICIDGDDNWNTIGDGFSSKIDSFSVTINRGHMLSIKSKELHSNFVISFDISKKYTLIGNCMSLLFGDDAVTNYSLKDKNNVFCKLFANQQNLVSVSKNFLPATILKESCYSGMFQNCTSLTAAPELPATTLAYSCYEQMFKGCTSLTNVYDFPAATLADDCCDAMFENCISLMTVPELPSNTLASGCYKNMFKGCTSLTTATSLPATRLSSGCYEGMFLNCTSLSIAPSLPATVTYAGCYDSMFYNCTSLTTAPELPATTLVNNCYAEMFYNCTNLNYIKMLATSYTADNALTNWVNGVSPTGTFIKERSFKMVKGVSGIPENWEVYDTSGQIIEEDDSTSIFGEYTESFNDSSYYGYPAKGILTIAESDRPEYDLKMTFFGGKSCAVTTYGALSNDGSQITTVQTSCNMGKFYPTTFNISIDGNNVTIDGKPKFDYPTVVPDYVATKS